MHQVLLYLLRSSKPLVPEEEIADMLQWEELEWQKYAEECKGMIVTNPGMVRPSLSLQGQAGIRSLVSVSNESAIACYPLKALSCHPRLV